MANVKVHLREIIKYVLLLGVIIQSIFGIGIIVLWLSGSQSLWNGVKSVLGVCVGALLSYLFLRVCCEGKEQKMYLWGSAGIVSVPIVLHTCLDGGWELFRFAGVCSVILICLKGRKHLKQKGQRVVVSTLAILLVIAMSLAGSGAPSLAAGWMSRCSFPFLHKDVYNITPQLRERLDFDKLWEATCSTEGLYTIFYPSLIERYGSREAADEVCLELAKYCAQKNTKGAIGNLLWDVAAYHFPMLVSEIQLQGKGYDAITAVNYDDFTQRAGGLGTVYWDYGVVWNLLSLVLLLGSWKRRRGSGYLGMALLLVEISILCLTMEGAGYFDYKNLPVAEFFRMGLLLEGFSRFCVEKDE
ncbi:MAG: hypothetical protein IJZ82_06785 [Lachnospiraceae bacterium]|nr:hypothetical protein [Lachnospiraceae bacterium]